VKFATIRTSAGTRAVRVDDDGGYVGLDAIDVGAFLAGPRWRDRATSATAPVETEVRGLAPVVPRPGKILCVGLNYAPHIREMGRDLPEHPTLFAKYPEALIGPNDPLVLPEASDAVDWEAELALVIGARVRKADEDEAAAAIAGFTVCNDVTVRDWQYRTKQWLQGKTFEATTPLGPLLVTPDELPGGTRPELAIRTIVGGEKMQEANTSELVFDPVALVRYVSTILTLQPGDVIATGTPGGVGHAHRPPRYLAAGDLLVTEIDGIGRCENTVGGA
jgi:acylpyruvate hydrolase